MLDPRHILGIKCTHGGGDGGGDDSGGGGGGGGGGGSGDGGGGGGGRAVDPLYEQTVRDVDGDESDFTEELRDLVAKDKRFQRDKQSDADGGGRVTRYPISIWEMTVSILSSPISLASSPISISRMTISIWSMTISITTIPYR